MNDGDTTLVNDGDTTLVNDGDTTLVNDGDTTLVNDGDTTAEGRVIEQLTSSLDLNQRIKKTTGKPCIYRCPSGPPDKIC